jgi:hypothetical protein
LRRIRNALNAEPVFVIFPNTKDDVILGVAATWVARRNCVWLMDDFITTYARRRKHWGAILDVLFGLLYRRAARRITVSNPMAREYERRYGKPVDLVLGKRWLVESIRAASSRQEPVSATAPLRVVWVGKYQPYYGEPIVALSRLLRAHPDLPVIIDLWGQTPPEAGVEIMGRITYRGSFDDGELLDILRGYDFGLLTYSFDEATRTFMRYSLPGKLIDYVSAGLPVITISPREISVCDEIREREIGPCVFSADPASILDALRGVLRTGKREIERWRGNALRWAHADFELEDGIAAFRRIIGDWSVQD